MKKISDKTSEIKQKNIGFMGHIIAGYPTLEISLEAARGILEGGADFIEVQFPFSDPTADGPTIETACYQSLENGFKLQKGFELVSEIHRQFPDRPVLIMTYGNLLYRYGIPQFVQKAVDSGASGLIIPDIPLEQDEGLNAECRKAGIDNILLVAPGTSPDRIRKISESGSGFLYTVLRRGITGKKTEIESETTEWLNIVKTHSVLPVAAGFGIQSRDQVHSLAGKADIAIAGSYFVKMIEEAVRLKQPVSQYLTGKMKDLL